MVVNIVEDIIPITKVREQLGSVVDRARETKRPIIVTQNGSAAVVILDAAQYQQEQESVAYLRAILDGLLAEGGVSHEEVGAQLAGAPIS